jgi:CRP-like cAMP-binding protein
MTLYTATAVRDGRWWVLTVDGLGATQSRALKDAPQAVRGLVSSMLDVDADSFEVEVEPAIDRTVLDHVASARRAVSEAARMQGDAAAESRAAARELEGLGLTGTDIASILEVSPQRVSQLLAR